MSNSRYRKIAFRTILKQLTARIMGLFLPRKPVPGTRNWPCGR